MMKDFLKEAADWYRWVFQLEPPESRTRQQQEVMEGVKVCMKMAAAALVLSIAIVVGQYVGVLK